MHNSLSPFSHCPAGHFAVAWGIEAAAKVHPCDASCKKGPPDASQNLDQHPQTIENQGLATPQINTFTYRETHLAKEPSRCVSQSQATAATH